MDTDDVQCKNQQLTEEIERLKRELDEKTLLAEERLNRLRYLQSDFDNYRKWSEKEKGAIITLANENLIKDLLVILDDFERAVPSLEQEKNREGISMVQKKFLKILAGYGLQPIDCEGKKFDPNYHEVLCKEHMRPGARYDPQRDRKRVSAEIEGHPTIESCDCRKHGKR